MANSLFTFDTLYSFNDESMCYDAATLMTPLLGFPTGKKFDEVLINLNTMKIKLNDGDKITCATFSLCVDEKSIVTKEGGDSDFEEDDSSEGASMPP